VNKEVRAKKSVPCELRDGSIDAGLYLLDITGKGKFMTDREIAFVCGCSRQLVWQIERAAIAKLASALRLQGLRELKDAYDASRERSAV
jgi:hypothetical protein